MRAGYVVSGTVFVGIGTGLLTMVSLLGVYLALYNSTIGTSGTVPTSTQVLINNLQTYELIGVLAIIGLYGIGAAFLWTGFANPKPSVAPSTASVLAICPNCKARVAAASAFCPNCGANLQPKTAPG